MTATNRGHQERKLAALQQGDHVGGVELAVDKDHFYRDFGLLHPIQQPGKHLLQFVARLHVRHGDRPSLTAIDHRHRGPGPEPFGPRLALAAADRRTLTLPVVGTQVQVDRQPPRAFEEGSRQQLPQAVVDPLFQFRQLPGQIGDQRLASALPRGTPPSSATCPRKRSTQAAGHHNKLAQQRGGNGTADIDKLKCGDDPRHRIPLALRPGNDRLHSTHGFLRETGVSLT